MPSCTGSPGRGLACFKQNLTLGLSRQAPSDYIQSLRLDGERFAFERGTQRRCRYGLALADFCPTHFVVCDKHHGACFEEINGYKVIENPVYSRIELWFSSCIQQHPSGKFRGGPTPGATAQNGRSAMRRGIRRPPIRRVMW